MGPWLVAVWPPFNSANVSRCAHCLNYIYAPQAVLQIETLDYFPAGSSFLTAGLSVSHVHIRPPSLEENHTLSTLVAFPFNCQINICSCQSPAHCIYVLLLPRGLLLWATPEERNCWHLAGPEVKLLWIVQRWLEACGEACGRKYTQYLYVPARITCMILSPSRRIVM